MFIKERDYMDKLISAIDKLKSIKGVAKNKIEKFIKFHSKQLHKQ